MSGWHILIIAVVLLGFGALVFFIFKSKMKWPTSRILKVIGGIVVALIFIRIADSYFATSSDMPERSFSQARENINNYTEKQRDFFNNFVTIFSTQGYILEICVNDMGYGTKSQLTNFNNSFRKIIDEAKIKEIINDDMLIDANALVRGAIETTRGGKITESDCAGAINYLGSLGMLTD